MVVVLLLCLQATWWDGAFQIRHWAPIALFTLVVLAILTFAGALRTPSRALTVGLAALWGLAAFTLLSAIWSESPGGAWEDGHRALFYAALVTIAATAVRGFEARFVGHAVTAAIGTLSLITLIRLHLDGPDQFLAGRLDAPVEYRNGTAALFAISVWPLVSVAATRTLGTAVRTLGLAGATLALGLAFLTQSRGVVVGLAAGAIIALGLGPDRLRRAWLGLAALGMTAAASPLLLEPYHAFDGGRGTVTADDIAVAANALTLLTAVAFSAGLLIARLDDRPRASARRVARAGLVVVAVAAPLAGIAAVGNPVDYARDKYDEFRTLDDTLGATRLTAAGGQRYDYWRIAWREFKRAPLVGEGADSFRVAYYRERATDRNATTPHSLLFEQLAETGIVGAGLLFTFLGGLVVAIRRRWAGATLDAHRVASALGAAGAGVVAQAFVDWFWLIPGLAGLGLFALGLSAATVDRAPSVSWRRPFALRAAAGACLLAAAAAVLVLMLSDFELRRARAVAGTSPARQLSAARAAGRLDPFAVQPLHVQAAALESRGDVEGARRKLESALDLEPNSFTTLALLGDLETRAGNRPAATRYYRRALALNPRDTGLRELARGRFSRAPP